VLGWSRLNKEYAACMDIGGTFIKYALADINRGVVGLRDRRQIKLAVWGYYAGK